MMRELPEYLVVGPYIYEVTEDKERYVAEAHRLQETGLFGSANYLTQVITINPDQAPDAKAETLLHEALHVISDMVGIRPDLGVDQEENIIRRLAPPLLQFLRQNHNLVDYLQHTRQEPQLAEVKPLKKGK